MPRKFYLRDSIEVSKDLLGKILVKKTDDIILTAKIVETEAYVGEHDPASHAYMKITERNKVMYDKGGKVYVYFIYGNYFCFNIVTGIKGQGNATLIRAVEPMEGIEKMKMYRNKIKNIHDVSNGPSKLCMALNIDKKLYGEDVTEEKTIFVSLPLKKENFQIATSRRIGLNVGVDYPYRFFIKDNPYVTKHKFNKEIIL
ncbi:MAG: DNA-3-methyladenine glycosylase [Ignavibacteria bacterium]